MPAWICDQCGEAIFELEQVDMIQRALDALDRETRSLAAATPAQSA